VLRHDAAFIERQLFVQFPFINSHSGIFYEYLRLDDPMSHDFLDRVVDGFPFLLGPLDHGLDIHLKAVKKNFVSGHYHQHLSRSLTNAVESLVSHAGEAMNVVQNGATVMSSRLLDAARSMTDASQKLIQDLNSRGESSKRNIAIFANKVVSSALKRDVNIHEALSGVSDHLRRSLRTAKENKTTKLRHVVLEKLLLSIGEETAPEPVLNGQHCDSSGIPEQGGSTSHERSMEQVFLGLVHTYLLLLLIASVPATFRIKTRRRRMKCVYDDDDDDDALFCETSSDDESENYAQ
jgi:hypothetical protein